MGNGYKLLYDGKFNGRNSLAVEVSENLSDDIFLVERVSDCLMAVQRHVDSKKTSPMLIKADV